MRRELSERYKGTMFILMHICNPFPAPGSRATRLEYSVGTVSHSAAKPAPAPWPYTVRYV